jgi:cell division protease FtsH
LADSAENPPSPEPSAADVPQESGLLAEGLRYAERGLWDEAIAAFSAAIRIKPTAEALLHRVGAAAGKCNWNSALADIDEVIRLEPSALAYHWRGTVLHCRGEYKAALVELNRALELDPDEPEIRVRRGEIRQRLKAHAEAIDDYSAAIRLRPDHSRAHFLRAIAHEWLDQDDAALADYTAAIRLDPEAGSAFFYRGRLHVSLDEPERAIADLTEALRLDAHPAHALCERGRVWSCLEQWEAALDDLNEALRLNPELADAYRLRGDVLDVIGKFEEARHDLETARNLTPVQDDDAPMDKILLLPLIESHFHPLSLDRLSITERCFPARMRSDIQPAIDDFTRRVDVRHFSGIRKQQAYHGISFTDLVVRDRHDQPCAVPPQYEEVDIGEVRHVRCLDSGLWLIEMEGIRLAVLQTSNRREITFQVAAADDEAGVRATQSFFQVLERAVREARSYRGKILSLEHVESYDGTSSGIKVHKLRTVLREQVILPRRTLELLDRNVIQFVHQRPRLAALGLATKKGLLFYGPPGTGKTHTLHYLAAALPDTTTLLISAEQVGLLPEYMTLARLLQPTMVVIEDADLIARDREQMSSVCEELLLNKLLNEMDGLKQDADILFVLTTNRPEALEAALSSRPGRIDQAVEFPHPDAEGRAKLARLYSGTGCLTDEITASIVKKTERSSAAFIKELMRRAAQFQLEREGAEPALADFDQALEELLFAGGSLNRKLLGGADEP